ncbi:flagellar protein FliS [Geomonas silvestris]|uniref:Flagellar secretion chaperone FliS n=1 Tax=Geomonas silvestris TaxID=2740184 RepID=A0A6V8MGV6_9BACT|nr:flagellar export chaperone FliS [Geomonas silvestris]GFO59043.1 flagellar protein FliS [Geomonas silvestris]
MYAAVNQYQNMQVTTASPEGILLMLCDGAVKFSRQALDNMNRGDINGKGIYIGKALGIVTELMNTLNHDTGGEIAGNLERLYLYVIGELTGANLKNDAKSLENAIKIMTNLRDTWTDAVEIVRNERCANKAEHKLQAAGSRR